MAAERAKLSTAHAELVQGCKALEEEACVAEESTQALERRNAMLEQECDQMRMLLEAEHSRNNQLAAEQKAQKGASEQAARATLRHAAELKARAEDEASQLRQAAQQEVDSIKASAEVECKKFQALKAHAEEEASQMKLHAQQEVDSIKASAEVECKKLLDSTQLQLADEKERLAESQLVWLDEQSSTKDELEAERTKLSTVHAELLEGCKALQTETQTSDEKMQVTWHCWCVSGAAAGVSLLLLAYISLFSHSVHSHLSGGAAGQLKT